MKAATGLPCGGRLQLSFSVADFVFRCQAVVRHRRADGLGLQFIAMSEASQAGIRALVGPRR